jgi:hypothetical protein
MGEIPGIGVASNQFERDLLPFPSNEQRNMWALDPFGLIDRSSDGGECSLDVGFWLCPHGMEDLKRVAKLTQTRRWVRVRIAIGTIPPFIPTCSNPTEKATTTDHISMVLAIFASRAGWRKLLQVTSCPMRMRLVSRASAAAVVQHSKERRSSGEGVASEKR